MVNLPSKIWHVKTSVALSRNEQRIVGVFRELFVKLLQSNESVFRRAHVRVLDIVTVIGHDRVPDAGWRFNIEHVGLIVPGVGVDIHGLSVIINDPRSVFLPKPKHRRASRATIEPDQERIGGIGL